MTSGTSDARPLEGLGVAPYATVAAWLISQAGGGFNLHDFRLAGGTALAWYLRHRISDDLDFFTYTAHALDDNAQARLARALTPISASQSIDTSSPRTLHATLVTAAGNCDVSFFELQDAVWVDPPERVREGFLVASLRDIGAMKLLAITGRCTKKDFYDLVALERHGVSIPELYAHARRMHPGLNDDLAREHVRRSLAYHLDAEADPDPRTLDGTTWPDAKRVAIRAAADIERGLDRRFDVRDAPPSPDKANTVKSPRRRPPSSGN
jgi:hypothetical protein